MDVGHALTAVARVVWGLGFGGFLVVLAVIEAGRSVRDLALRVTGHRVPADVVDVDHEQVSGETYRKHWVLVRFTTRDGRVMDRVRLRNWSFSPPRVGARIRVSYRSSRPHDADRARISVVLVTLLFPVPFLLVSGLGFAGLGLGLWG